MVSLAIMIITKDSFRIRFFIPHSMFDALFFCEA
jgi:hypothetical protein